MLPIKKIKVNIEELVEECSSNARRACNAHAIEILTSPNLPKVACDYYLIHILLFNLIINALEKSPPHTKVTVKISADKEFATIAVYDEGAGIPEQQPEIIFEKFYSHPDDASAGIGLGLFIAKTIAELHGGKLFGENLPEGGAKFSLLLPID